MLKLELCIIDLLSGGKLSVPMPVRSTKASALFSCDILMAAEPETGEKYVRENESVEATFQFL